MCFDVLSGAASSRTIATRPQATTTGFSARSDEAEIVCMALLCLWRSMTRCERNIGVTFEASQKGFMTARHSNFKGQESVKRALENRRAYAGRQRLLLNT